MLMVILGCRLDGKRLDLGAKKFRSNKLAKAYIKEQKSFEADRLYYMCIKSFSYLIFLIFKFSIAFLIISE
ncbi:hypothetical protein H5410_051963 [Solanum commersonii]|uniref:Uncharacterized protein n=1 Tax=Solanum commersonii TaxID=4109 RepID=A0A9J5X2N0_SOLCO|nr:hypothetical protein H5410_051963 [Solanum commersonii]